MQRSPGLQRFIDDELERAPLLMREVIAATLEDLRRGDAPTLQQRRQQFELQRPLGHQSALLVSGFVQRLGAHVAADASAMRHGADVARADRLALLDEETVAADVEVSRAIEAIKSTAEAELRELRGYTSALAGEVEVGRDSNPFRPETYVQSLWQATEALPVERSLQISFMHHFAMPLAATLRSSYAAACRRLDHQGIEPAAYRTVILPPGSRRGRPNADRHDLSSDMNRLRETMPAPLLDVQIDIPDFSQPTAAIEPAEPPPAPASSAELQLRALVEKLFAAMLADPALPAALHPLLTALQAPVVQVALREPGMIDNESHAAWRFLDRLAFAAEVPLFDPPSIARLMRVAQGLIDHIARAPVAEEALYRWAEDRLSALQQHALLQRQHESAEAIDALERLEAEPDPADSAGEAQALEPGTLDTVPAGLLDLASFDAAAKTSAASAWLDARDAGDVLRIFMQSHWTAAQVLWRSRSGALWLVAALPGGAQWALRRNALERLYGEGLTQVLDPRSLVHDAAEHVLRDLGNAASTN